MVDELKEALLEAQVEAALGGHNLGSFEEVENGYQAECMLCKMTTWVGKNGLRYSILKDSCPGNNMTDK